MFEDYNRIFIKFLVEEKRIPLQNILSSSELRIGPRIYYADMAVIDLLNKNYLCAFEFKFNASNNNIKNENRKYNRHTYERLDFPFYTILFQKNNDFEIFLEVNNILKRIEKSEFPNYETLSGKINTEEKIENNKLFEEEIKIQNRRKKILRETAISSLLSILVAVGLVSILTKNDTSFFSDNKNNNFDLIIKEQESKLKQLSKEISEISIEKKDDDSIKYNDILIKQLSEKVDVFGKIVDDNPGRVIEIKEINNKIQLYEKDLQAVKELNDEKIRNVNNRIDTIALWTSGLLITIFGSIIGFAVSTFKK